MRAQVLGFYGKHNLGDQAFQPAIQQIVGAVELDFVDEVRSLDGYDALIIGGGSFLDQALPIYLDAPEVEIPVIFLGVGIHGHPVPAIHPDNVVWIDQARLIVARNRVDMDVLEAPDLLFARGDLQPSCEPVDKRLLILANGFALPNATSAVWQLRAWENYELVMGRVIDDAVADGWEVSLQPMCAEPMLRSHHDDRLAAGRLLSAVSDPSGVTVGLQPLSELELVDEISAANMVISSRLHGCILPAILGRPFVGISAHDKVRSFFVDNDLGNVVDFYDMSSGAVWEAAADMPSRASLRNLRTKGHERWVELQATVREALGSSS